ALDRISERPAFQGRGDLASAFRAFAVHCSVPLRTCPRQESRCIAIRIRRSCANISLSPTQASLGNSVHDIAKTFRLNDEQRIDWLRLIRSQNVGPRGIMAQTPQAW